jgi:hypothetical protein
MAEVKKLKKDDQVRVKPSFLVSIQAYTGQEGEVTSVHAAPQIHVRLESGEDLVFDENDLELAVTAAKSYLTEMVNVKPELMDDYALKAYVKELCAAVS